MSVSRSLPPVLGYLVAVLIAALPHAGHGRQKKAEACALAVAATSGLAFYYSHLRFAAEDRARARGERVDGNEHEAWGRASFSAATILGAGAGGCAVFSLLDPPTDTGSNPKYRSVALTTVYTGATAIPLLVAWHWAINHQPDGSRSDYSTRTKLGWVAFGFGVTFAAASIGFGIATAVTDRRLDQAPPQAHLGLLPTDGGGLVVLSGTF